MTKQEQIERKMLLTAAQVAYTILGDIRHQWAGRHTTEGQAALCFLRDAIATAEGRDPQEVQDEYSLSRGTTVEVQS